MVRPILASLTTVAELLALGLFLLAIAMWTPATAADATVAQLTGWADLIFGLVAIGSVLAVALLFWLLNSRPVANEPFNDEADFGDQPHGGAK